MITPPATSLVRIRKENGFVVGAGFLIDNEQHLLTCAHVVARACNCDPYQRETPQATILLDSPFLKSERLLKARVVFWQPIQDDGSGDIAGLELLDDLPIGSEAVSFAPAEYLWDHDFRVYGFPKGDDDGIWATGRLLERQGTGWIQIDDTKTEGFAVVEGFSGGPV